jgi:N-acetylglucosaminylphosphatidylinositol deacetylase
MFSCVALGVKKTTCVDDEKLPDSMTIDWPTGRIIARVHDYVRSFDVNRIITFDDKGISGHTNHRALYHAMVEGLEQKKITVPVYALNTVPVISKYSFVIGAFFAQLLNLFHKPDSTRFCFMSSAYEYLRGREAMQWHKTQLVWFRYLYLLTSRYMLYNEINEIKVNK